MLRVAMIQTDLQWENVKGNLEYLSAKIVLYRNKADIVLLPELFSTGFTMSTSEFAEDMDGSSVQWMKSQAASVNAVIGGSIIVEEQGNYMNRFLWVSPEGKLTYYDKKHLFRMGGENKNYTAGNNIKVVELNGWRIRLNICYDLRFPVWSRNTGDYDVLVNIANWPESRRMVWKTLLQARAIENHCYVIGLNRIGRDGNGITYSGDSMAIEYKGNLLKTFPAHKELGSVIELDLEALQYFREKFPVHLDSDPFKLL